MNHSFNVNLAIDFSVNIALFLEHLKFWTFKNLANKTNIHDGKCWSYDTLEALADYFPYWTKSQRETVINSAVAAGLVSKGNYNKTKYDRTVWYALTESAYSYFPELMAEKYLQALYSSISENSEMDFSTFRNLFPINRTPIPDTLPGTDPDTKDLKDIGDSSNAPRNKFQISKNKDYTKDQRFMAFYNAYPKKVKPREAHKAFKQVVGDNDVLLTLILADLETRKIKHTQWLGDRQFISHPASYLKEAEYEGEIINTETDKKTKNEELKQLTDKRLAEQEAASQKRAEQERQNNLNKQSDANCYRLIQDNIAKRPEGLLKLRKTMGM